MDLREFTTKMLEAIRSGGDLYVRDQYITGPDRVKQARELLIKQRDACSDPDEAHLLNDTIRELGTREGGEPPPKV
jgi:hypothetical protein